MEEGKDVQGTLQIPATVTIGKDTYQVTNIGESAFENCTALQSVVLPEGMERVDLWAFRGCTNLLSVTFPKSMKEIAIEAFKGCQNLKEVTLNGIKNIYNSAFKDCTQLTVTLHGITMIENDAFYGCRKVICYLPEIEALPDHPNQK